MGGGRGGIRNGQIEAVEEEVGAEEGSNAERAGLWEVPESAMFLVPEILGLRRACMDGRAREPEVSQLRRILTIRPRARPQSWSFRCSIVGCRMDVGVLMR